jgi:hypothetical protein
MASATRHDTKKTYLAVLLSSNVSVNMECDLPPHDVINH